tara:strand:+ start:115 stop:975 length:861 start_codon:yes stop_codon:yes gene_type:complete
MSVQQNKNFNIYTEKQKEVLELEKYYFKILYKIFSQKSFSDELKAIMDDINSDWEGIHKIYSKANVVDLAVERHINFRVYNDSSLKNILKIYPSVISSDTAFVTDKAVINIDSKTNSVKGNPNDWGRQTVGINQISLDNKSNHHSEEKGYVKITGLLKPYYNFKAKELPVLSFFLSTLYFSNKEEGYDAWYIDSDYSEKPYNDKVKNKSLVKKEFLKNIKFACMPHRSLSDLFKYKIVDGVKTYAYDPPKAKNPSGTKSVRIAHESLENRYDSNGNYWSGFESWTI